MRVVFMGTPQIAASILKSLSKAHEIVGVFTRPDAVRARGKGLVPSPVKAAAIELGIPVFETSSFRTRESVEQVSSLKPDVACVVAYGAILPKDVLETPKHGCLNVHASLLPRWRGAAPMERAILAGDEESGVSIMKMEEGLDTGPYCVQGRVRIDGMSVEQLTDAVSELGSQLLFDTLSKLDNGISLSWTNQTEEDATYAEKIGTGELDFRLDDSAWLLDAKVRASSDGHPARMVLMDRQLTVEDAQMLSDSKAEELTKELAAGQAVFRSKKLMLKTADGILELKRLKPAGKKSMDAVSFAAGIQNAKKIVMEWGSL